MNPVRPVPPLPVPNVPVMDDAGKPVALAKLMAEGVPKFGVTKVGELLRTREPEPVLLVTPVPPLATFNVPETIIAPDVPIDGVKPVEPKLKDDT